MRMGKFARAKNYAIGRQDIPSIGIMLPPLITMANCYIETIGTGALLDDLDADNVGLTGDRLMR